MGKMFDDFDQVKKMKDPEARQVEDLKRSKKKLRGYRKQSSSVSMKAVNFSLIVVSIVAGLAVAGVVAYGVYFGIQLYLNG